MDRAKICVQRAVNCGWIIFATPDGRQQLMATIQGAEWEPGVEDCIMTGNDRNSGYARATNDWYVEPRRAIDALLDVEAFDGVVWDPACGGGNIPDACRGRHIPFIGSDIEDRGWPHTIIKDFLHPFPEARIHVPADHIITNPPYGVAEKFVHRALENVRGKVAVIVRTAFLEGQGRYARLYKPHPPARIWQFSWRVSMPPGGVDVPASNGSVSYCWIVWDREHVGAPVFGWLS